MRKRVVYLARWDLSGSRGVVNKINGVVDSLCSKGYDASALIVEEKGWRGHVNTLLKLFSVTSDVLIVRATAYSMPLLVLGLFWLRYFKSTRVVIDVPTPFVAVYDEVGGKPGNFLFKKLKKIIILMSFPWTLWVAHRVVQYAHESQWFSFGLKRKAILMANGIDCEKIPQLRREVVFDGRTIEFICVANVEFWHGFDRLLRGVSEYVKSKNDSPEVLVRIVGDGGGVERLRSLAQELGVNEFVRFEGEMRGASLTEVYEKANVGVSSLALHRKGLTMASDLKTREYVARGVPVVYCADDLDVDLDSGFFFRAEPGEAPLNIMEIIDWYIAGASAGVFETSRLRGYAINRMDFRTKVSALVD